MRFLTDSEINLVSGGDDSNEVSPVIVVANVPYLVHSESNAHGVQTTGTRPGEPSYYTSEILPASWFTDTARNAADKLDAAAAAAKRSDGSYLVSDTDGDGDRDMTDLANQLDDSSDAFTRQAIQNQVDNSYPQSANLEETQLYKVFRGAGDGSWESIIKPLAQWADALQHDKNTGPDLRGPL